MRRTAVDVVFYLELLKKRDLEAKTAIVVDVLRATSTIVAALEAGFERVAAVRSVSSARRIGVSLGEGACLFGGERGGLKIPGFSFGNSPLEYLRADRKELRGKTLVFTTTNGTRALLKSKPARTVLVGSTLNARATANAALSREEDVVVVCAGTEGMFSADDFLAAGALVQRLAESDGSLDLSDSALAALGYWKANRNDAAVELAACWHGRRMTRLGFSEDIRFCANVDAFNLAAEFCADSGFIFKTC